MKAPLTITPEPAKALSATTEVRLLQDALAKHPASTALQSMLVKVLNELDQFDEIIALLAPALDTLDSDTALVLARACFAKQDDRHLALAQMAADRALCVASGNFVSARAMADQAKVRLRLGENDAAIAILRAALALDRHSTTAFKRLSLQLLRQGHPSLVEQLTRDLIADGICHSRVLAARTMALAALGRDKDARSMVDIARFLHNALIAPPLGWESLDHFNAALVAELTDNSAHRLDRFGTASTRTWRLDSPTAGATPLWQMLLEQIARTVEIWANSLSPADHPWLAARPERAMLRSWCVITEAEGYERWHMHPDGWSSGGYYPLIPLRLSHNLGKSG
ncbi:MAG: hypothetical protein AABZ45_03800, partial [Pseudomonadota bacterium]